MPWSGCSITATEKKNQARESGFVLFCFVFFPYDRGLSKTTQGNNYFVHCFKGSGHHGRRACRSIMRTTGASWDRKQIEHSTSWVALFPPYLHCIWASAHGTMLPIQHSSSPLVHPLRKAFMGAPRSILSRSPRWSLSNQIDNQEETAQGISLLHSNVFLIHPTGKEKELHFWSFGASS